MSLEAFSVLSTGMNKYLVELALSPTTSTDSKEIWFIALSVTDGWSVPLPVHLDMQVNSPENLEILKQVRYNLLTTGTDLF